jgi:hypothetical protein
MYLKRVVGMFDLHKQTNLGAKGDAKKPIIGQWDCLACHFHNSMKTVRLCEHLGNLCEDNMMVTCNMYSSSFGERTRLDEIWKCLFTCTSQLTYLLYAF